MYDIGRIWYQDHSDMLTEMYKSFLVNEIFTWILELSVEMKETWMHVLQVAFHL